MQTAFALLLAMLINRRIPGVNIFRTIYFSPVVITMVVVAIVWYLLFNPGQGFINQVLKLVSFGTIEGLDWLKSTRLAFPAIMILSIWQGGGIPDGDLHGRTAGDSR